MQITIQYISDLVNGEVEGDGSLLIQGPAKIEEARTGNIAFLGNPKYEQYVYETEATALLVAADFVPAKAVSSTLIRVPNVYAALAVLLEHFNQEEHLAAGISDRAFISPKAELSNDVSVGHFAVISDDVKVGAGSKIFHNVYLGPGVEIGEGCIIHPGVRIMRSCKLGHHCVVQCNTVIGSDGFGFAKDAQGQYARVEQIGRVELGNHVEIGANTVIDRATMGATRIAGGVKMDNLIQVAHNVEIDSDTVIAAQTGISGSTKIGKHCMVGGQVGFVGHISIADGTMIQAQTGVASSVKEANQKLYGYPAMNYQGYLRSYAHFRRLPDLAQEVRALRKEIESLKTKQNQQD